MRAVGTNAFRVARDADAFLAEAGAALGFPIEVVFGREEARLIYLGVAHSLPASGHVGTPSNISDVPPAHSTLYTI